MSVISRVVSIRRKFPDELQTSLHPSSNGADSRRNHSPFVARFSLHNQPGHLLCMLLSTLPVNEPQTDDGTMIPDTPAVLSGCSARSSLILSVCSTWAPTSSEGNISCPGTTGAGRRGQTIAVDGGGCGVQHTGINAFRQGRSTGRSCRGASRQLVRSVQVCPRTI